MKDGRAGLPPDTVIGVLSLVLGGEYYGGLLAGIQHAVARHGGRVVATRTLQLWQDPIVGVEPNPYVPYSSDVIAGVILVLDAVPREDLIVLQKAGKPIVSVSTSYLDLHIPEVVPDNRTGTIELVHHLVGHGHGRIGFVGHLTNHDTRERFEAYQTGLREAGIEPDPAFVFHASDDTETGGITAAEAMLGAHMPCSAVYVATDENALGFMTRIQKAGYTIPAELAIVSFDDSPSSALYTPALTSVQVKPEDIGVLAAETLLAIFAGSAVDMPRIPVAGKVIYRQSCGCLAGRKYISASASVAAETEDPADSLVIRMLGELGVSELSASDQSAALLRDPVERLVRIIARVVRGQPLPIAGAMAGEWRSIIEHAISLEGVSRAMGLLRRHAQEQISEFLRGEPAIADNVIALMDDLRTELLYAARYPFVARAFEAEASKQLSYNASRTLLEQSAGSPRDLSWLRVTPTTAACLGLWSNGVVGSELIIESIYTREDFPRPELASSYRAEQFPPLEMFKPSNGEEGLQAIAVIPLQTAERDWGALAIMAPTEVQGSAAADTVWQWAVLLVAALERERLLESLRVTEQRLLLLAHHDALTGLPNRALFYDRVELLLSIGKRYQTPFALMLLDLNKFKVVNDTFGHAVGDRLLQIVAERAKDALRDSDTVARLGGDEFAILIHGAGEVEAREVADRIREALREPLKVDQESALAGVSIGIAIFPGDGETYGALFERADRAMYAEKHAS
jgi:diguanylate cyclase (GGDEF)-like protein